MKKYFSKDILAEDGLFILPLGFKLPFKPEDFFTKRSAQYVSSQESRDFIESMVHVISDLHEEGIEDTIVVGFDIYLENVKRLKNSDLLVAITSAENVDAKFAKVIKVQISDEPNAQKVSISDEDLISKFPLQYSEICRQCKEKIPNFKQNRQFNAIMKEIKKNPKFAFVRRLNPNNNKSSQVTLYAANVVDEISRIYQRDA